MFLSCLFGSELAQRVDVDLSAFLSCLFGSEPIKANSGPGSTVSKLPIRQ